jgi:hypothetical protein
VDISTESEGRTVRRTVKLASRYIMRSLRWRIGVAESLESEAGVCAGFWVFATPLGVVGLDGR